MSELIVVLYVKRQGQWKLADFGLSCEGTSGSLLLTHKCNGTSGYRAPEITQLTGYFNDKTDIWALGCILYELAFNKKRFSCDREVWAYYSETKNAVDIEQPNEGFGVTGQEIVESIRDMTSREPFSRPSADFSPYIHRCYTNGTRDFLSEVNCNNNI